MKKINKGQILIGMVGLFSLVNIINNIPSLNYLSLINSLVGLTGVTLFILKKGPFQTFIRIWILAQAVIISHTSFDPVYNNKINDPIFDCSQALQVPFGITFTNDNKSYGLYFNLMVVVHFMLFRFFATPVIPDEIKNIPENYPKTEDYLVTDTDETNR